MKILIIGTKGFIGSHLSEHFQKSGHQVIGCDIRPGDGENYFQVEKFDTKYQNVFDKHSPDACIYAGGSGNVPLSVSDPETDYRLNTVNVANLLYTMKQHSPKCKFIHISSAAVYGNPESLPVSESAPVRPVSPYGWHKYLTELICREFYTMHGMPTCSIRVFSVYGELLMKQLFWDIYQKTKSSKSIELFGTGEETRDFIFISDLVRAIDCVLFNGKFSGESINVSSGIETTIREAASYFCSELDPEIKITFNGRLKAGDPLKWRADTGMLTSMGFKHSISLREGLARYAKWVKEKE